MPGEARAQGRRRRLQARLPARGGGARQPDRRRACAGRCWRSSARPWWSWSRRRLTAGYRQVAASRAVHGRQAQLAAGPRQVLGSRSAARSRRALRCLIVSSDVDGGLDDFCRLASKAEKVVCDVTAYGRTGPRAGQPDSEWQIQALSGIVETTGMADGAPVPIPLPIVEFMTGVYAAASIIAALRVRAHERRRPGDRHGALRLRVLGDGDLPAARRWRGARSRSGAPATATP